MAAFLSNRRWLRTQDIAWILFVSVLLATGAEIETNYDATILLVVIGAYQIMEPRLGMMRSRMGPFASSALKLLFCYLLLGWSHTIYSPYQSVFFLPVVSAATTMELGGVLIVTTLACLAPFSFLLPIYIDWTTFELQPGYLSVMILRSAFFAIVAMIVYDQAKATRNQVQRTKTAAKQLAESNRSLRRAEVSLRRSERLAALGQLTAGLAHELRNPLSTIRASAEMMAKPAAKQKPELLAEMADYIKSEADRMNGLVSHFLDFARPLQIHPQDADFQTIIGEVLREQSTSANEREVVLSANNAASLRFQFDPDLMRIVLSNLVQNAVQASHAGGQVTIAARLEEDGAHISVADSGEGIEAQHLENIFNPFFTTKASGVGLGLAIVAKIVDEHGGRIKTQSTPGAGARFEITLPKEQQTTS